MCPGYLSAARPSEVERGTPDISGFTTDINVRESKSISRRGERVETRRAEGQRRCCRCAGRRGTRRAVPCTACHRDYRAQRTDTERRSHGLRPNESRLSCGAKLECSQTEFYNAACKTFSGSIGDGRRQLQARVRQPFGPMLSLRVKISHEPHGTASVPGVDRR